MERKKRREGKRKGKTREEKKINDVYKTLHIKTWK